jgi:hypothetical protein
VIRQAALALLAGSLVGCAPCAVTRCGQCLTDNGIEWTLEDLQAAEDDLLGRLGSIGDPFLRDPAKACRDLSGLVVALRPEASWDLGGRPVLGTLDCLTGWAEIGGTTEQRRSIWAHEALHWIQRCSPSPGVRCDGDAAHHNWGADGLNQLERDVRRGVPSVSVPIRPREECPL